MKKFSCSILIIILAVLMLGTSANAAETVDVYVNGNLLTSDQSAIIVNGRTLVPLRPICEALNCKVTWNDTTQTAQIQNDVTIITVQINNYLMSKSDRADMNNVTNIDLDIPPILYNDSTMVPARAIAEALYAEVLWNEYTNSVDITMEYDYIGAFNIMGEHGTNVRLAEVKKDGKYGYINEKREAVVPVIYDKVGGFVDGYAIAERNGKWGCVNVYGQEIVPFVYDVMWGFSDGFSIVAKDKKFGMINKYGNVAVPIAYDSVDNFSENMARVMLDNKWGYVNTSGVVAIPLVYDKAGRFHDGKAQVEQGGKEFYIDVNGKIIN